MHKPMIINRDLLEKFHLEDTVCCTILSEPFQARLAFPLSIQDLLRIYLKPSRLGSPQGLKNMYYCSDRGAL